MISQITWGSSDCSREKRCYLWGPKQKWAHGSLMKFPKCRCKVLDPGQNNNMQLGRLGAEWLKTALHKCLENHDGQEVEHQLVLCCAVKMDDHILGYVTESVVSSFKELIHIFSTDEIICEVLCTVWGFSVPQWHTRESMVIDHQGGKHLDRQEGP